MNLTGQDRQAINFMTKFLNNIVHIPVPIHLIKEAAENEGDPTAMWYILIDLTLLHVSDLPDEPQSRLCKFWDVLSEEGHDEVPVEGAHQFVSLVDVAHTRCSSDRVSLQESSWHRITWPG